MQASGLISHFQGYLLKMLIPRQQYLCILANTHFINGKKKMEKGFANIIINRHNYRNCSKILVLKISYC